MSVSFRDPPQRRRSLGPVSPKRIYRNLSVRLRGGDSSVEGVGLPSIKPQSTAKYMSLWEAVENGDALAVQNLLCTERRTKGGDREMERVREGRVNRMNEQGLVPMDVAVLTHNSQLLHLLVTAGARHNPSVSRPSDWSVKLDELVSLAGQKIEERRAELQLRNRTGPQAQADVQKQLSLWTHRQELYTCMRERFHLTEPPGPPAAAALLVESEDTLMVSITEPAECDSGLVTTYKVEWSSSPDFSCVSGCGFITDIRNPEFHIAGLHSGMQYYVRVSAYNIKGWGAAQVTHPASAIPSSWSQCSAVRIRSSGQETAMRALLQRIREPHYRGYCTEDLRQVNSTKRMSVSRGIKQLFHPATKFIRLLQRGVYLAVVFYQKERILVTLDEQIPLVEVHCCSTSISQDFLWLAKLSCAWQQVPWLQQAMSSSLSSSSSLLQNRYNILQAVTQLQAALGSVDLGQVYYEPLKDHHGNILLVTLREVVTALTPLDPTLHWTTLSNLDARRTRTHAHSQPTAVEKLTLQIREVVCYHSCSVQMAVPGLYVGILKLCSSVEQLRVLLPAHLPNLLCHAHVRDNPHITRDEWSWLQRHAGGGAGGSGPTGEGGGGGGAEEVIDGCGVEEFVRDFRSAVRQLLTKLNIPLYRAYQYGVYTQELVCVSECVRVVLLLPPSEEFSAGHWSLEGALEPTLTMPLHIFELVHFWAYGRELLSLYCQAWVRLELDVYLSQKALREAMDSKEVQEARERLEHVTQLSQSLDSMWRERRWILDVMQCVRSRRRAGGVPLQSVMNSPPITTHHKEEEEAEQEKRLTHIDNTEGAVLSHLTPSPTAPVDIPVVTQAVLDSRCPSSSCSIPSDRWFALCGDASYHDNGIPHIHSCPELSAPPPPNPLPIKEEEEEWSAWSGVVKVLKGLDLRRETMPLTTDLESVVDNRELLPLSMTAVLNADLGSAVEVNSDIGVGVDIDLSVTGKAALGETAVPLTTTRGRSLPSRSLVEWVNSSANWEAGN